MKIIILTIITCIYGLFMAFNMRKSSSPLYKQVLEDFGGRANKDGIMEYVEG